VRITKNAIDISKLNYSFCRFQETTVDLSGIYGAGKLWPGILLVFCLFCNLHFIVYLLGKDYVNCYVKDFMDVDNAFNGI
jgi:hypothetical protein